MSKTQKYVVFLTISFLIIFMGTIQSEEKKKISVFMQHQGKDLIGSKVAYEVKEKISSSAKFELINSRSLCLLAILIDSIDVETQPGLEGARSALAVTYVLSPVVLSYHGGTFLYKVESDRVKDIADSIVTKADTVYEGSSYVVAELLNMLRKKSGKNKK